MSHSVYRNFSFDPLRLIPELRLSFSMTPLPQKQSDTLSALQLLSSLTYPWDGRLFGRRCSRGARLGRSCVPAWTADCRIAGRRSKRGRFDESLRPSCPWFAWLSKSLAIPSPNQTSPTAKRGSGNRINIVPTPNREPLALSIWQREEWTSN